MVSTGTITAFKQMAADSKRRRLLVKDSTCMGGLVLVLSNPDRCVVSLALETLILLAEDLETQPFVCGHVGMLEQLEAVLDRSDCDEQVHDLAEKLYILLTDSPSSQNPLKDTKNTQNTRGSGTIKNRSFMGSRCTKSVILQIRGIYDQSDRDLCMRLLLRVKGVISITFDMNKKRCLLRTKAEVKPELLVRAISKTMTMSAQQVIKNEKGDETLINFNISDHLAAETVELEKENNVSPPPYLSDDEDEKRGTTEEDKSALSRGDTNPQASASKWFSAAANFLTNSFYW